MTDGSLNGTAATAPIAMKMTETISFGPYLRARSHGPILSTRRRAGAREAARASGAPPLQEEVGHAHHNQWRECLNDLRAQSGGSQRLRVRRCVPMARLAWLTNRPMSIKLALLQEMLTVVHTESVSDSHLYPLNCSNETMPVAGFLISISTYEPTIDINMCHVE